MLRATFEAAFAVRTRDEWSNVFAGTDACVTPVLCFAEVAAHPHIAARETIIEVAGVLQAAPALRFSRSIPDRPRRLLDRATTSRRSSTNGRSRPP